jgi:hypothetical protein
VSMLNRENDQAAWIGIEMQLERIHAELQAGLAQFQGTGRIDGARYLPAGRPEAWNGRARLVGWSVRAEAGAVSVTLRNGDEHGDVVAVIELPTAGADTAWFGPSGIACPDGLYIQTSGAGVLAGGVFIGAVD